MIKENENRAIIQTPNVVDRDYIRWMGYKEVKCQDIEKVLIPGIKINLSCLSLFKNLIIKDEEQDIKIIEKSSVEINKSRKSSTVSNTSNKNNSNVSNSKAINTNKRKSNTSNKSENKDYKDNKEEKNKDSNDDKGKDVKLVNETNVISTYLEAGLRFFDLKYKIAHTHLKDTGFYKSNKVEENNHLNTHLDDFDKSLVLILNQIKEFIQKNNSESVILDISDLIKFIGLVKKEEFDEKIVTRNSNTGNINVNVNNPMNNPIINNSKTSSNMIIQKIGNKISNLFGSNKEINKLNKDNNSNININTNIKSNFNNNYINNNNKNINVPNSITSKIANNSNNNKNNNINNNINNNMNSHNHIIPYENSKDINLLIEKIKSILKSNLLLITEKFMPLSIVQLEKLKGKVIIFLDKNSIHEIKTASPKYERMKLIEKERESLISPGKTNDSNNALTYTKYALIEKKILNKDSLIFRIIKFGHFFLIHEVKTKTDFDDLIIDFESHFSDYNPNIIFVRDFNRELIRSMIDWNFTNKSDVNSNSKKRSTVKSCDSNLEFFNASKNKSKLSNLSSIINIRDNKKSVDYSNHNIYNNYSNIDEINKERKRSRYDEERINKNKDFDDFDFDKKLNEHNDLYFDDNGELRNNYNNYDFIDQNMSTISDNDFTMNNLYNKEHLNSNINKTNNKSQSDKTTNNFKLFNQFPNDVNNNANNKSKSNKEHQSSLLRNNYINDNYKKENSLFNSNFNKNTSTNQVINRKESDNSKNNKNNKNENNMSNKNNNESNSKKSQNK